MVFIRTRVTYIHVFHFIVVVVICMVDVDASEPVWSYAHVSNSYQL